MDSGHRRAGGKRNVFKGSVLVSILLELSPRRFPSRPAALHFARRLLRQGYIASIFGSTSFDDSAQLYMWQDDDTIRRHRETMTSSGVDATSQGDHQHDSLRRQKNGEPLDAELVDAVKSKVLNRTEAYNIVTSYNNFFQELQQDDSPDRPRDSRHTDSRLADSRHSHRNQPSIVQQPVQQPLQHGLTQPQHASSRVPSSFPHHPSPPQHSHHPSPSQQHAHHPSPSQQHAHHPSPPQQHAHHHSPSQQHAHRPSPSQQHNLHPSPSQQHAHHPSPSQQHAHHPSPSQQHAPSQPTQHTYFPSPPQQHTHQEPRPGNPDGQQRASSSGPKLLFPAPPPAPAHQDTPRSHHTPRSHQHTPRSHHQQLSRKQTRPPGGSGGPPQQAPPPPQQAPPPAVSIPHRLTGGETHVWTAPPSHSHSNRADVPCGSTCSTDSSLDTQTYFRTRDRNSSKRQQHHHVTAAQQTAASRAGHCDSVGSRGRSRGEGSESRAYTAANQKSKWPGSGKTKMSSVPPSGSFQQPALAASDPVMTMDRDPPETMSSDYDLTSVRPLPASHPQSVLMTSSGDHVPTVGGEGMSGRTADTAADRAGLPWGGHTSDPTSDSERPTAVYPYSDNEKQLMEEMKRMKKEHQDILRTYEGRINKLMAKMHELRSIAEMLENSSTKPSPYGLLPAKASLLNIIASGSTGDEVDRKTAAAAAAAEADLPPPLPPRPGRGGRVYPNKPILHTRTRMKTLNWNRIILGESGEEDSHSTVWHGLHDLHLDTEDLERRYSVPPDPRADDVTLLDDISAVRGRPKQQLLAMFDGDRSQRILTEMRNLRCSLHDVITAVHSLDCRHLHQDSFAELLELLNSPRDVDRILHHAKRKGPGQLDTAEFLIFELSKLDHFRERLEFLRFKNKLQINLFEIDQQLRELNTACDELTNNVALKRVLQTILSVGNYLNGGTERGQADGFGLDILNKLKDFVDRSRRGNLLELVMRLYCTQHEADLDLGCPTRFRLPEPSNMRHAAQVSFEEIQKALRDLREELSQVRERLEGLSRRESSNLTIALRVSSENFLTSALEVLVEERRILEDTKGHFWKTTSYFHCSRQNSPQEFFQIFATFLHDCKYYWKLAHRNLARDQFERDFCTKCQLSCSSVPGFRQLKDSMMRTVATLQQDRHMRASKAQQLQHINTWIESLGKYDHDLPKETTYGNDPSGSAGTGGRQRGAKQAARQREEGGGGGSRSQHQGQGRSTSPKPIVSTPPNVHKPQALSHVSPAPGSSTYSSNTAVTVATLTPYQTSGASDSEAQEGGYEPLTGMGEAVALAEEPVRDSEEGGGKRQPQDGGQRKSTPFSLKSWLKRDQRQRSSNDELPSPTAQSPSSQQPSSSGKSPTTPFNKLRHTVVHKLASSAGSKKSNDTSVKGSVPTLPPEPSQHSTDPEPCHQILFPSPHQQPHEAHSNAGTQDGNQVDCRDYQNFYYQLQDLKDRMYPGHNSAPSTLSSVTSREFSPHKYESLTRADGSKFRDRLRDLARQGSQEYYLSPSVEAAPAVSPANNSESAQKEGCGRNRAPIAVNLGSNMSISDVYGHTEEEPRPQRTDSEPVSHYPNILGPADSARDAQVSAQPSNVDSKRVKAQSVPVYKAKLIPNYENQTKLDPRIEHGVRGQAEPVYPPSVAHLPQSSDSSEVYRQELQRKSEMYVNNYPAQSPMSPTANQGAPHGASPHTALGQGLNSGRHGAPSSHSSHMQLMSRSLPGQDSTPKTSQPSHPQDPIISPKDSANPVPQPQGEPGSSHTDSASTQFAHCDPVRTNPAGYGPVTPGSQHYELFQTPARRSASAQDVLDGDRRGPEGPKHSHSSEPGATSRTYLAGLSSMVTPPGRKVSTANPGSQGGEQRGGDLGEREASHRTAQEAESAPAKVSALISRWEKKQGPEEVMGGPLVDGQDNPPSMTSTPITRRKHGGGDRKEGAPHLVQSGPRTDPRTEGAEGARDRSGRDRQLTPATRGPRSQSQPRERQHGHTVHNSHSPHRAHHGHHGHHHQRHSTHTPHAASTSSSTHPRQAPVHSGHPPAHHHPSTNTYPPRSSHLSPPDARGRDDGGSSSQEQAGGQQAPRREKGGPGSRPVPLPRQHVPASAAMAVVKPTVLHTSQLTYMDI